MSLQPIENLLSNVTVQVLPKPYREDPYVQIWGDVSTRLLTGHPSDVNFPVEFSTAPAGEVLHGVEDLPARTFRVVTIPVSNATPTAPSYGRYQLPIDSAGIAADIPVGTRFLFEFDLAALPSETYVSFGAHLNNAHDSFAGNDQVHFSIRNEHGRLYYRFVFSDSVSPWYPSGLPDEAVIGRPLVLEIERVSTGDCAARLYRRDASLDIPLWNVTATKVGNHSVRAAYVGVGSSTSVTWGATPLPDFSVTLLRYVDVEVGTGSVIPVPSGGIVALAAKKRLFADRTPMRLTAGDGLKSILSQLSSATGVAGPILQSSVGLDSSEPQVTIRAVVPETRVLDNTQEQLRFGGDQNRLLRLVFTAATVGRYSVRLDATSIQDGVELATAEYLTPGGIETVVIDTATVPDGLHRISIFFTAENGLTNAVTMTDITPLTTPPTGTASLSLSVSPSLETGLGVLVASTAAATGALSVTVA